MRRASFPALLGALLLYGCARPDAPVISNVADTVTLRDSPGWLPAGWVEDLLPSALPLENGLTTRYSPQDAAAPMLLVSRYTVGEADALAKQAGGEALIDWLVAKVTAVLEAPGSKPGEQRRWRREGLRQGQRVGVIGVWPEGVAGRLSGAVGVGQSISGSVLIATALAPCLEDGSLSEEAAALVDLLLASVPVEQGLAVPVPDLPADQQPATP